MKKEIDLLAEQCKDAALRLHIYLMENHLRLDGAIVGPDPGVRINLRVGRFIKSYTKFIPWNDSRYHLQGQGYWILSNKRLYEATGDQHFLDCAVRCADVIISRQHCEGYWIYDNPEWSGLISTVDGCFGGIGLLGAYKAAGNEHYLEAAKLWYKYMISEVGFQYYDKQSVSLNYFANRGRGMVPNNSTLGLWFIAELYSATDQAEYLEYAGPLINFLSKCQLESGEMPYVLATAQGAGKVHYLCYQYNAFQFMDLVYYYCVTKDERVIPVLKGLIRFLENGLASNGEARFDCYKEKPTYCYYTAALAAAFLEADKLGLGNYAPLSSKAYECLLMNQRNDGGFDYSLGNYLIFSDRRSYPKIMSMILYHLVKKGVVE